MDASIEARHSCTLYAPLCHTKSSCLKKGDRQSRSSNLDMYVRRELGPCAKMECVVKPRSKHYSKQLKRRRVTSESATHQVASVRARNP
jgi:hypothetical protein